MQISLRSVKLRLVLGLLAIGYPTRATTVVGPWVPVFKGVDYSVSTNTPGGGDFPRLQVVHAFRVDLRDPDIRLFATPPISNYVAGSSEVGGLTTSDFLRTHRLQAALSANFFDPGTYYLPAGTPMDVFGLEISEGIVVSTNNGPSHSAAILFDTNNVATVIHTNWPSASVDGIFTAVSGNFPLVVAGQNVGGQPSSSDVDPRTGFGLSQDRRYLYLMGIDGRQGQEGYSEGANYYETGAWLLLLGAYDGVNMDGGGSTLLVIEDSTGVPLRLSKSSAVADSGRERTMGSHFGIYAKPLPGFINDVVAVPEDTTARITWTTIEPSTTEVQFGVTTNWGSSSGVQTNLVTNHVVQLTGLTPWTGYYFRAISSTTTQQYVSSNFFFFTTNYVTTNQVFGITNSWKYTNLTANLTGLNWTGTNYADSAWSGPGPGLLWVERRFTLNPDVAPRSTEMPGDPSNGGRPYITYYFRTHFVLTNLVQGGHLAFSGYVDDGAVFYLNGAEIYRLRMPDTWDSTTLATNFPCAGDAEVACPDTFTIPYSSITNLAIGDNVVAVEVHNYNPQSADITFGLALDRVEPLVEPLPGFINDVVSVPGDTTARITWTTLEPSSSEVQYGVTTNLGSSSGLQPAPVTNHVVQLTGLTPETGYYYRVLSSVGTQSYVSSNYFLVTGVVPIARLDISYSGITLTLSWDVSGFVLQSADSLDGQWNDVPGIPGSPYTVVPSETRRFYRLRR